MTRQQQYSRGFVKNFDNIPVPLLFNDMMLWVGADEALKILHLNAQALAALPESEKRHLKHLCECTDSNKLYITALGVALLASRLLTRGCVVDNFASHEHSIPQCVDAFANIFLTDVLCDLRRDGLLCCISRKESEVINLLDSNRPETTAFV
ncbi:pep2 [Spodoptera frugiperda granulovirus]|uniref:Pep2 n=1 Tax=Spodoptera frugiperda granulovirus TaxID=307454 RepID=A0A068FPG0_9BBAC|nr:pep2 [Spodoptera frugiperda granulovirus]AID68454.1 pep2 [Spodoptera frugiperda granulovirus]AJK91678.1 pep2 [Spodoptera frugiperda granulovirus]